MVPDLPPGRAARRPVNAPPGLARTGGV